jgi:hypothetical protein
METEMVLVLTYDERMEKGFDGVFRPVYTSAYVDTHVRVDNGHEWAFVKGAWTLLRVNERGLRYVVSN